MRKISYLLLIIMIPVFVIADSVSFMGGQFRPRADSDIWETNFHNLILSKKDFNNTTWYFEWEHTRGRAGLVFGLASCLTRINTEYRDYEFGDGSPIQQTVTFKNVPFFVGLRLYPIPVGRRGILPFIGAGLEYVSWQWKQDGYFIDFSDANLPVYEGNYKKDSGSFGTFLDGGILLKFDRRYAIRLSAIYQFSRGDLEPIFLDFEPIDLSGLILIGGISFYY